MGNERSDEEIVKSVQKGDTESFGRLMERYEAKIARYARKFLSNPDNITDLVQDVFIKAYVNIRSFDAERKFSSWLYRIAHNEFVNALKKQKREVFHLFDADTIFPHPVAEETADSETNRREIKKEINRCLGKILPKYREVLILYYFDEMSYEEISDVLRIPVATVGVRLYRGKEILRKLCEDFNQ